MKAPKPNRRTAIDQWGAWRQRALMAEEALRIMTFFPNSKEAESIRESAKAAYEKKGLEIPSEQSAPIGGRMTPVSTETDAG